MSPVPPPAGSAVHSEDWTDDPSFEIDISPSQFILPGLPSSPSSSSSSTSHRSLSFFSRPHAGSPLRSSHTAKGTIVEDEEDGFDFELPTTQPRSRSATASSSLSSASIRNLSSTIIGAGPSGGTITRLGSNGTNKSAVLGGGTIKAKMKAVEKAWEADIDFDMDEMEDDPIPTIKGLKGLPAQFTKLQSNAQSQPKALTPPKLVVRKIMPGPDALDDLDGFDIDLENDDEATLKAGATIKAMLPPPRKKGVDIKSAATPKAKPSKPPVVDEEMENDLVLPLNMSNLKLVTQSYHQNPFSSSGSTSKLRPRNSMASTNTEWDSPGTSSGASGKKSLTSWDDSPKRYSETSATSLTDSHSVKSSSKGKPSAIVSLNDDNDLDAEDDMEFGLELPDSNFFAPSRAGELNRILDKKRKPQFAPPAQSVDMGGVGHRRTGTDETWRTGDDSIEDGLVFDNPRVDFSKKKLDKSRKARTPVGWSTKKSAGGGGGNMAIIALKEREKREKERERERNWGRSTPIQSNVGSINHIPNTRERMQSGLALGLSGMRSHSASATGLLNNNNGPGSTLSGTIGHSGRRGAESPLSASHRPRTSLSAIMAPPPPYTVHPSSSSGQSLQQTQQSQVLPQTLATVSRLRHQKSHAGLSSSNPHSIPPPSPSLTRQKSMASLQESARNSGGGIETPPPLHRNYNSTSSRLTAPTTSSKAKAKVRPSVTSVFPRQGEFAASGSTSSISTTGSRELITPQQYHHSHGHGHSHGHPRGASSGSSNKGSWGKKDAANAAHSQAGVGMVRRFRNFGDGTELEGIEDLSVEDDERERQRDTRGGAGMSGVTGVGIGRPKRGYENPTKSTTLRSESGKERKKSASGGKEGHGSIGKRRRGRDPGLIRFMGGNVDQKRVVGGMEWNPTKLRWEGNESVLRDFDPPTAPTVRPALIAHLTGSSLTGISGMGVTSPGGVGPAASGITGTIRIVGDMRFDPEKMCWISTLDPEDEEPDPFEGMADDEDDEYGGTIKGRAKGSLFLPGGGGGGGIGGSTSSTWSSRMASESGFSAISIDSAFSGVSGASTMSAGSAASGDSVASARSGKTGGQEMSQALWNECKEAEERHKREMRGWTVRPSESISQEEVERRERREWRRWREVRYLAMDVGEE